MDENIINSINGIFEIDDDTNFKIKWRKSKKRKGIEIRIRNEHGSYKWLTYENIVNIHEDFKSSDPEGWFMQGIAFYIGKKYLSIQSYELLLKMIKEEENIIEDKYPNLDYIFEDKNLKKKTKKEEIFNKELIKNEGRIIHQAEGILKDLLHIYEFEDLFYADDDYGNMHECFSKEEALEFLPDEWELIRNKGEIIAKQDWDSGAPGIGAGVVTLYKFNNKYFVEHEAGIDEYSSKEEAMKQLTFIS